MINGKPNKLLKNLDWPVNKILVYTGTKKRLSPGDKVKVIEDCVIKGTIIEVKRIDQPSEEHPEGRIIYDISGATWKQIIPRIVGCEWVDAE